MENITVPNCQSKSYFGSFLLATVGLVWSLFVHRKANIPTHMHIPLLATSSMKSRGGSRISSQGGAHLKKSRRAEGDAKNFGVFRVKNHDFTTKNLIFSNCGGRRKIFWGISCEKSRFYAKKNHIFSNGSPGSAPAVVFTTLLR